jgi:hypothetical protein
VQVILAGMSRPTAWAGILIALPLLAAPAHAQTSANWDIPVSAVVPAQSPIPAEASAVADDDAAPQADAAAEPRCALGDDGKIACDDAKPRRKRIFPIWADKARMRDIALPRPFGVGAVVVSNNQDFLSRDLAVSFGKGDTPPSEEVTDVPFVTTDKLRGYTDNVQFKADLWILAGLDAFVAFGQAKGPMDIGVNIDLDALFPPPICRPANPCGVTHLDFTGHIDNTITTIGAIAAYGGRNWFVSGAIAKTLSISAKGRSDVETTNAGLRAGPRFEVTPRIRVAPYAGVNYFDMDTTVTGEVTSPPIFPDGDTLSIRYRIHLTTKNPWAYILGATAELNTRWQLQVEYDGAPDADRIIASIAFRM